MTSNNGIARQFVTLACWKAFPYPNFLAQFDAGDRVAILSPNNIEWITIMYATAMMGAILVPLNSSYKSAELRHVLQHCKPTMLIAAARSKGVDLIQRVLDATGYSAADGQTPSPHLLSHLLFLDAPAAGTCAQITCSQVIHDCSQSHCVRSVTVSRLCQTSVLNLLHSM